MSCGVGIGDHRPNVMPDDTHLIGEVEANQQLVDVLSQDGFAVAETIDAFGGADVVVHAAARMILGTVVGYDLETFDALHPDELTPGGPSWSTSRHRFSCGMAARS